VHGLFLKKKLPTVSLSIDVRITMILCVVYLLRIFKMFHGLMNNPVFYVKGSVGFFTLSKRSITQKKLKAPNVSTVTQMFQLPSFFITFVTGSIT